VFAPANDGPHAVVVLVHGGSWVGGDPGQLDPLAAALADRGVVVFNSTYHTMRLGGRFPGMVEDVACAVAFARDHAAEYTATPQRVFVVGHSAGAHLGSLVSFAPSTFECPSGAAPGPDGFVGLAGPYDTDRVAVLAPFYGGPIEETPETWEAGNPFTYVETINDLDIMLVHGAQDLIAPVSFSEDMADALTAAGKPVRYEVLSGADHRDVVDPAIVADLIAEFVTG